MSAAREAVQPQIRRMQPQDIDQVHALERDCYEFPWSRGIFRDCMRVGYACSVMLLDGQLVGYSVCSWAAGEAHLLNLCTSKTVRSRGLGRELLRHALRSAWNAGAQEMFLEVRPSNSKALSLYHSVGFVSVGRRPDYYRAPDGREDALVLNLPLGAWVN